jgi:thymidylate kinase
MIEGSYIVIDGITGSGKTTILEEIRTWSKSCGHTIFDLDSWCKQHHSIPRFEELEDMDVIFASEPTSALIGKAIRNELSHGDEYSPYELAHAFSLDRHILANRLVMPARKAGKLIIQSRSVSSSIAIQSIMDNGPSREEIMNLPGNAFCLANAPDHLILTHVPPETVHARLAKRDTEDKGIFEKMNLLIKEEEVYKSKSFSEIFSSRGTHVHQFDANQSLEDVQARARQLIGSILKHC